VTAPEKLWGFVVNHTTLVASVTPEDAAACRAHIERVHDVSPVAAYVLASTAAADVVSAETRGRLLGREDIRGTLARAVWGEEAEEPDADQLRPSVETLVEQAEALRRERDALAASRLTLRGALLDIMKDCERDPHWRPSDLRKAVTEALEEDNGAAAKGVG
jgi:hypothetical protein